MQVCLVNGTEYTPDLLASYRPKMTGATLRMTNTHQVIAVMIWNIAEFITLCVNRKGIHPGAHIGLDLILSWALFSAAAISFYNIGQVGENALLGKYTAAAVFAVLAA
jgi:hypothetical protein